MRGGVRDRVLEGGDVVKRGQALDLILGHEVGHVGGSGAGSQGVNLVGGVLRDGLDAGEVVLGNGVVFQVGDAHAHLGEVGGQFLDGVLHGR